MEQSPKLKYKRILLKLSGEVLKNREKGDCIDADGEKIEGRMVTIRQGGVRDAQELLLEAFQTGSFYGPLSWNKLFDARLFREKGIHYDETMLFGDDASVLHRVFEGERCNCLTDVLYHYRTRAGQITGPLRDRFGVLLKLELYGPEELSRIIQRSAGILDQPITPEGAYELAKCSRGTPRVANRFLKRIRDFATVLGDGIIDRDVALLGLKRMDVDALGLDELDRSLLRAIIEMYNGGPVGLETLAAALGEEAVTLEDLCEPYLMQMGFLTRTPRGRCATRLAYEHLGLKAPETGAPEENGQQSLF